jgi:outer membrane protein assembly factor BamB
VKLNNKALLWQRQYSGAIYSTPVLASGKVVFGTADGYIRGLDLRDGKECWRVKSERPVLAEAIPEGKYVYIGGDQVFYKINAVTGQIIWNYDQIGGPIQGKPALSGKNLVFGAWDTYLYCLDKNSGKLNWKWTNGKSQKLFSPGNIVPAIAAKKVFIVAPDRYFTALDLRTGKEIWRTNRYTVRESMGISPDGKEVYAKLMNDSVIAVSTLSAAFELTWAANAGTGYDHNPCPVESNGKMIAAATKNGLVYAIHPIDRSVRWKFKTGNASVNKLMYQKDGSLWLTTTDGKIISLSYKP